ncbi:MAG: H-X9-DG-CTERM domain-containing protein, partial [Limisphaerales bacterium]
DPNPDNTNTTYLVQALTGPYCQYQVKIFKCPDDNLKCTENSVSYERVRSYSINYCMEGDGENQLKIKQGWPLDEVLWGGGRYGYQKLTDIGTRLKGPDVADAWVFCEENADSINNGCIAWGANSSGWADTPASEHTQGDNFSFADGHVEYHKWVTGWNSTLKIGICEPARGPNGGWVSPGVGFNAADYNWVTQHGSAPYP